MKKKVQEEEIEEEPFNLPIDFMEKDLDLLVLLIFIENFHKKLKLKMQT